MIVAANPDYYHTVPGAPLNGTFYTTDGGQTWQRAAAPTYRAFSGVADPSLAVDAAGRAYYLSMGETPGFCGEGGNVALVLSRSSDLGRTYGPPSVVDTGRSDDKPYMAVDTVKGRPIVYVSFTRWTDPQRQILFTRSSDGGATFGAPQVLYASPGVNMGAVPVPGPSGHVAVVWAHYATSSFYTPEPTSIIMRSSADAGRTFGPAVTIARFTSLPRLLEPGAIRIFTFPTVAVNPRTGTLYVAWVQARALAHPADQGEMDGDLVLVRSRDQGRTWSRPVVIDDTVQGDRFMPALSVDRSGVLRVAFYDRRVDHVRFGLYGVAARDLGDRLRVWPNRQLSAALSSPSVLHYIVPGSTCVAPGRFMGDYIGAASMLNGDLAVTWTDSARNVAQETDVWFARVPSGYLQSGPTRLLKW